MLQELRSTAHKLVIKVILGFLVVSFVFWGIGSIPKSRGAVVQINNDVFVEPDQFQEYKRNFIRTFMSNSSLVDVNVDPIVANYLVQTKLFEIEYKKLGFIIGQQEILQTISQNKSFFDKNGNFDQDIFNRILASYGLTFDEYVEQVKLSIINAMMHSVSMPFTPSAKMVTELYNFDNHQRVISLVKIQAKVNDAYHPSEDEIVQYYQAHQKDFMVPEKRNVEFLVINPRDSNIATQKIIKEIDDNVAAGETLKAIAQKYQLAHHVAADISKNSTNLPQTMNSEDLTKFVVLLFETQSINAPSEVVQLSDKNKNYYVLNNVSIEPESVSPLAKVKNRVVAALKHQHNASGSREKMVKIYNDFSDQNQKFEGNVQKYKDSIVEHKLVLSRKDTQIPAELLEATFALSNDGEVTKGFYDKDNNFVFIKLHQIKTSSNTLSNVNSNLKEQLQKIVDEAKYQEFFKYILHTNVVQVRLPESQSES